MIISNNGMTLEKAQNRYNMYLEAEEKILLSKEYEIDGQKVTRENLKQIRLGMAYWSAKCDELATGASTGARMYRVIVKND